MATAGGKNHQHKKRNIDISTALQREHRQDAEFVLAKK
jgi:hypothetical protein